MEKVKTLEEMNIEELKELLEIQKEEIECNLGMPCDYFNLNIETTGYYEKLYREIEEVILMSSVDAEEFLLKFESLIHLAEFKGYNHLAEKISEAVDFKHNIEDELEKKLKEIENE